ncbi:alanine racemase [Pseudonocardia nematodicida]|uniref:Alanine racemase n=1 Tax=Pseudonocardia nematodicida TaxID=1206997 RepID=A0ABV1KLL0_9PSEU
MRVADLTTPALLVDAAALEANLADMASALPGPRLRPHVKAHKTTALAARQAAHGHHGFTCATIREIEGMAAAGLGTDLLLANEVLDARRLGRVVDNGARVTVAVDSAETVRAAADGGVREVLVDVDVGQHRCGTTPETAGALADAARAAGLTVRGVMGYEGHLQMLADPAERARRTTGCTDRLRVAHADVGGEIVSGGGTGTHAMNTFVTEIQAGSYALMDTAYTAAGLPFRQALTVLSTVVFAGEGRAVADAGLKALATDHGHPTVPGGTVVSCADEHLTYTPGTPLRAGDRIRILPAHVDPTVVLHERLHVVDGDGPDAEVLDTWAVDLRGW